MDLLASALKQLGANRFWTSSEPPTVETLSTLSLRLEHYEVQYANNWQLSNLDRIIGICRASLALWMTSAVQPDSEGEYGRLRSQDECAYELAVALGNRFRHTGHLNDVEEVIKILQRASADAFVTTAQIIHELASALTVRFNHAAGKEDIDKAMELGSSLIDVSTMESLARHQALSGLAQALLTRHEKFGGTDDLSRALQFSNEAMAFTTISSSHQLRIMHTHARILLRVFIRDGDLHTLREAAALHRLNLDHLPVNHRDRWLVHQGLGVCSGMLHEHSGEAKYLRDATNHLRCALDSMDKQHLQRLPVVSNLALSLDQLYRQFGNMEHLDEGITLLHDCMPDQDHLHQGATLALAHLLQTRYETLGADVDLDECIRLLRLATPHYPPGHPTRALVLENCGNALGYRFQRRRSSADIVESVMLLRTAKSLHSSENARSALNLASSLGCLFRETEYLLDLEEANHLCEVALAQSGKDHPLRDSFFHTSAWLLMMRYTQEKDFADLNTAISHYKEALRHQSLGQTHRHTSLRELAAALRMRYSLTWDGSDAEHALAHLLESLELLPEHHVGRALSHFELAKLYAVPHTAFYSVSKALRSLSLAMCDTHLGARDCLGSAIEVINVLELHMDAGIVLPQLSEVYMQAINLLPYVAYFDLKLKKRLGDLRNSDILATKAAIHALQLQQPEAAIERLEEGRTVFWAQHVRLRTPFDGLPPELAGQLTWAAVMLERGSQSAQDPVGTSGAQEERKSAEQRALSDDFAKLVLQARQIPGFERFLLPPTFDALCVAAKDHPVVVLLADATAAFVVIIRKPHEVQTMQLPGLSREYLRKLAMTIGATQKRGHAMVRRRVVIKANASSKASNTRLEHVLEVLWYRVVLKVVRHVGFEIGEEQPSSRLFLCPTGPFVHLPLHAAGRYGADMPPGSNLSDYCVRSYIPTLGALLAAQRAPSSIPMTEGDMLLVAVSQPAQWRQLPCSIEEIENVVPIIPMSVPVDILSDNRGSAMRSTGTPTVKAILDALPKTAMLHLACHGYQDANSPLDSGFAMSDGMLTVSDLMSVRLEKPLLAVLSACETAKGDKAQPDQAIHLAATMLFAGFRSVVGTMWSMDDVDGPEVAASFYEELFRKATHVMDSGVVPYALDRAVRELRDNGVSATRWAPYVHIGA